MNNAIKYAGMGAGAFTLFAGSFLAFAALSGKPMSEIAVVGDFFPTPEMNSALTQSELLPDEPLDTRTEKQVVETASAPLQAFILEQPFSSAELDELQSELKAARGRIREREGDLGARERDLESREAQLTEQLEHLVRIRTELQNDSLELEQRKAELTRDEQAHEARESASWSSLAQVFMDGKAKDLSKVLTLSTPEDAAKILRALPVERATELLREIDRSKFLEYSEAYRKAEL